MLNKILIFSLFLSVVFHSTAEIYSFEESSVPSNFSVKEGSLQSSNTKYKLATHSLEWKWRANSKLTVLNPEGLEVASQNNLGGIQLWIYNTVPSTSKLVFSFANSEDKIKCHLDYNLNFKGWRCLMASFASDMDHDKSVLTKMIVEAPATGNGKLYFDYLEFQPTVVWSRMSNPQYKVHQSSAAFDFFGIRADGNFGALTNPTASQVAAGDTILQRLSNWYTSTGKFTSAKEMISRKSAIDNQIQTSFNRNKSDLNLSVDRDGTVTGEGLFPEYCSGTIGGVKARKFRDVITGCMLPLANDYMLNKTAQSKTRWINMLDWFNDQGWADGSAFGGLMGEKLRSAGYFHSLFIMRNELDTARLNRELNTLNWFCLWGEVNRPFLKPGENTDQIRTMCSAKLTYALLQKDTQKRAAALGNLTKYFNNAFAIAPGFLETFKPDYSGYHHAGTYFSAYYPDALYTAAWVYFLLHDTPYALSDEVYSTLKNCLLTYRNVASLYNVPESTSGRFPMGTQSLDNVVPAFAYLALSKKQPDRELLAAFGRLWKPTQSPMKELINNASTNITLQTTFNTNSLRIDSATLNVSFVSGLTTICAIPSRSRRSIKMTPPWSRRRCAQPHKVTVSPICVLFKSPQ